VTMSINVDWLFETCIVTFQYHTCVCTRTILQLIIVCALSVWSQSVTNYNASIVVQFASCQRRPMCQKNRFDEMSNYSSLLHSGIWELWNENKVMRALIVILIIPLIRDRPECLVQISCSHCWPTSRSVYLFFPKSETVVVWTIQ